MQVYGNVMELLNSTASCFGGQGVTDHCVSVLGIVTGCVSTQGHVRRLEKIVMVQNTAKTILNEL